jgi:hypothetical protein
MKQKDIAIIIAVVFVSGLLSYFVSKAIFSAPENLKTEVEVVEPITADFPEPDTRYFNANSVNPTLTITIGGGDNQAPFQTTEN